ncbi:MAG TPA: ABC transporter substrate-binding protein [Polyangiaceae bacterium]
MYSWWRAPAEETAFDRVIGLHVREHPDVEIDNLADWRAPTQRDSVAARILAGAGPSTFQANIGADLLRWTVVDTENADVPSRNHLEDLSPLLRETGLTEQLPAPLLDALGVDGRGAYAVPINIHRANVLYYRADKLAEFRAKHQNKSFLDLATLCPGGSDAPPLDLKIAIGAEEEYPLVLLAFENLLPALTNGAFYRSVFEGSAMGDYTVEVRKALDCARFLSRHSLGGESASGWFAAVEAVQKGFAAFTVVGDWASGVFVNELNSGEVIAVPFPGSEETFVFTSDTFPLLIGVEHREEVLEFLRTIAGTTAQSTFSTVKGSIPARNDANMGVIEAASQIRREDFLASEQVLATSGFFPPYYPQGQLGQALQDMVAPDAGPDRIDAVVNEIVDAQPLFSSWQRRLREGASAPATP